MTFFIRRTVAAAAALTAALALTACSIALLHARSHDEGLPVGHEKRTYILHVPAAYHRDSPVPLVILLHGHGSRAETFERLTGMSDMADQKGFIVAYPQALGSPSVWHSGVDGSARIDDVAFIRTLIQTLREKYNIDPDRIYVGGHSNGAFMAYRVGAALSATVAAVGISAGSIGRVTSRGDTVRIQTPDNPVSVVAFHGLADNSVPYFGGKEADGPSRIITVPNSMRLWVTADHCGTTPDTTILDRGNVTREEYHDCLAGTSVVLYTIANGTHRWAGDEAPWWEFWHDDRGTLSATDSMWAFFAAHPRARIAPLQLTH